MSQREWDAETGTSVGLVTPVARPVRELAVPLTWPEIFLSATPAQQREMLCRTRQQGALLSHQFPPPPPPDRVDHLLSLALDPAASVSTFPPVAPALVDPLDSALDGDQRQAVARAVAADDFCTIAGGPGTGKGRIAAEIVRQAVRRSETVLVVAPTAGRCDAILERLVADESVNVLRSLTGDETLANLSPTSAACTLEGREHHLRETTLPAARLRAGEAASALATLDALTDAIRRTNEHAAMMLKHEADVAPLLARRAAIADQVRGAVAAGQVEEPLASTLR